MCKTYNIPNIVWLRVTDYMHGWLERELGGEARIGEQPVLCMQHLPGAKEAMKMETTEDLKQHLTVPGSMSAMMHNYIEAGLRLDPEMITREYGVAHESLQLYMPIETPKICLTQEGVLRPWTLAVTTGREQTAALQRVIRHAFWQAVEEYNQQYAQRMKGKRYVAIEMIEAFCADTRTPDTYADAMRREWQRRTKRDQTKNPVAENISKEVKSVPITQLL